MVDKSIFERIQKIQKHNKLYKSVYTACIYSIIGFDYAQGLMTDTLEEQGNKQRLDIDSFYMTVFNDANWRQILDITALKRKPKVGKILPDIQQMRLLMDALILCMKKQGIVLPKDIRLTMPSSAELELAEGFKFYDYADRNECLNILNVLEEQSFEIVDNTYLLEILRLPLQLNIPFDYDKYSYLPQAYFDELGVDIKHKEQDVNKEEYAHKVFKDLLTSYINRFNSKPLHEQLVLSNYLNNHIYTSRHNQYKYKFRLYLDQWLFETDYAKVTSKLFWYGRKDEVENYFRVSLKYMMLVYLFDEDPIKAFDYINDYDN